MSLLLDVERAFGAVEIDGIGLDVAQAALVRQTLRLVGRVLPRRRAVRVRTGLAFAGVELQASERVVEFEVRHLLLLGVHGAPYLYLSLEPVHSLGSCWNLS